MDALVKTGLELRVGNSGGLGAWICKIGPDGCDYPEEHCVCQSFGPGGVYWTYHHLKEGKWRTSTVGAGSYRVKDGDVEGWAWSTGNPPTLVPTFEQVCASARPQATNTAPRATSTRIPPTVTRRGATIPAVTRRPASRTPTRVATNKPSNSAMSVLPQPVDTAPATFAPTAPVTLDTPGSIPSPQQTQEPQLTISPSDQTPTAQTQETPVRVERPTQTPGRAAPTVAAPPTNAAPTPPSVPTTRPVATAQPTVAATITEQPATATPTIEPPPTVTLPPQATSTPTLTLTPASATAQASTSTSTAGATPITDPLRQNRDSESLARNIALALGAVVLVGLAAWAALRRRRGTIERGGNGVG